jgi:hypothetical protein
MFYEGDSDWVMLGECDSEQELLVVRALLESEGIECLAPRIFCDYEGRPTDAGFPLQVHQADLEKARALLEATPESFTEFPKRESGDEEG